MCGVSIGIVICVEISSEMGIGCEMVDGGSSSFLWIYGVMRVGSVT